MKASDIERLARTQLQDAGSVYWTAAQMRDYLNFSRLAMCSIRPDLYESTEVVTLAEGTRQALPGGKRLLRVLDNVSHPERRAITLASEDVLARFRPRWRALPGRIEVAHVLYNETTPAVYEVYPPVRAGVQIRISYAKPPAPIPVGQDDDLDPEGELAFALVDAVLARAFEAESDATPAMLARAQMHEQLFRTAIGADAETKLASSPNRTVPGAAPVGGVD